MSRGSMSRVLPASASLLLMLAHGPLLAQTPPSVGEPRDIVVSLYKLAVADVKGPQPSSPFYDPAVRAKYFSKDFDRLITNAETKASKEGEAVLDFDPVSSSQDSELKTVSVKTVLIETNKAFVSARFDNYGHPVAVTYAMTAEDGAWKIDNMTGAIDKDAWSVRKLLDDFNRPSADETGGK